MPAAVAAYISTATLTAASVLTAAQITAMTYAAFAVGAVGVGNYQRRKAKRKAIEAYNASLEDRLVMTATTNGPRSRCYGRVRNTDGVLFKATRGANKEFYTLVIAVAGHEIDGFEGVYFGDELVTLDGSGYVQTAPYLQNNKGSSSSTVTLNGSGGATVAAGGTVVAGSVSAVQHATGSTDEITLGVSVSGSTITLSGGSPGGSATVNWQTATGQSYARVRFYTGAPGQDLSTVLQPLFPDLITAGTHRFAGIACLLVDLEYNPDAFPAGVPDISAVFRGARVLDPRTSTTAWTENPALIARDWALYSRGGGLAAGDINAASFNAAASACEVTQAFTTPSGTVNLPLYTCGIVAKIDDGDPSGAFAEMVESMAGKAGWAGGQLRVVAGVYRAPVATITEDWVIDAQPVQVVPEPPTDEAVNVYRPTIADKAQGYVTVPAPEVRATTYVTADGRELPREITLGGVTDTTHAQHVCGVLMRDARNAMTVVLPCNLRAFQLELFDVVSVTLPRFGWASKVFEVVDWQFSLTGGVTVTLKETAAAIFQPDAGFAELDLTPNTALPDPSVVPTIGALTVTSGTSLLSDGTQVTRARVQWPAPADQSVSQSGAVEIQYWPTAAALPAGDWIAAPPAPGNAVETTISGLKASTHYTFRARFVNALGVHGAWGTQAGHMMADPPPPQWTEIDGKPADSLLLNTAIAINGSGQITGIGTGAGTAVANTQISLTAAGALLGAGGGSLSLGSIPGVVGTAQIDNAALTVAKFAAGIEPVGIITGSTVPTSKTTNTIYLTGTGKVYRWEGSGYTAAVPTSDLSGTIVQAQIADGAVNTAKFAAGLEPVSLVSSVPGSLSTRAVFNTADGKLYRWNGSAYVATVPAGDLAGVVGGGNLVPNSGFRVHASGMPTYWAAYNNGSIAATYEVGGGLRGQNAVRVTAGATATQQLGWIVTGVEWQGGQVHWISFWVRSAGTGAVGVRMSAQYANHTWDAFTETASPALQNGTWQLYVARAVPTAGHPQLAAKQLFLSWLVGGAGITSLASGSAFDISLVQVEIADAPSSWAPKPDEILPGTITATEISDNAVTTPKLVAGAVVAGKIAANAVGANEIAANAVTADKVAANAITAGKIQAGAVSTAELAAGAVNTSKLAANAVTANEIAAGAVTTVKLAANAVTANELAANAVTADKILANAITAGKIAAGAVSTSQLAAKSITTDKLVVTPGNLVANSDFATGDATNWRAWVGGPQDVVPRGTSGVPGGAPSNYVMRVGSGIVTTFAAAKAYTDVGADNDGFAVEPGAQYLTTIQAVRGSGVTVTEFYVIAYFYNNDGTLSDALFISSMATAMNSVSTWAPFSGAFTAPANALRCWLYVYSNANGNVYWSRLTCQRRADASLIVDGAVIAAKIAANAVTADKVAANAITAGKIAADALTVGMLSTAINGGASSGGRVEMATNVIRVFDSAGTLRVRIGALT